MDIACKRSGQIPPFGNWDYANDLPITQYFESARQAGLIRFSSAASGECDHSFTSSAPHLNRPPPPHFQDKGRGRRCSCGKEKEQRKQGGRVCDADAPPRKPAAAKQRAAVAAAAQASKAARPPKAVDEDLYKIPPDLLHSSKRKKMWGIFSRCLVPACMV